MMRPLLLAALLLAGPAQAQASARPADGAAGAGGLHILANSFSLLVMKRLPLE